jgi:hypothetical protein
VQLLDDPLLIGRVEAPEVGVAAQNPFLILDGKIAVLIEPIAQMSRRSIYGRRIPWNSWASIPWNGRARIGWTRIGLTWIYGARCYRRISISGALQPVPLRAALGLRCSAALVWGSALLRPDGLRPGSSSANRRRGSGAGRGRAAALAASPGRGKTHNRNRGCQRGCQRNWAHSSRIEYPDHNSLPAKDRERLIAVLVAGKRLQLIQQLGIAV